MQNEYEEKGRSPLNRANTNTLYRDNEGPYYKDYNGREIRGAEANYIPVGNPNQKGNNYNENPRYGSGREMRESARNFNRNQPGSKPYGGQR